ncbi:MAG: hypothetical protein HY036_06300 [Nitrospirae bacterium]|nr:hypothetical protein [Nitrospirota bacterium]
MFLDHKNYRVLWLEILFNDRVSWETYLDRPEVREAYQKACIWFSQFKTMIQAHTGRKPLESRSGKIDPKDYRQFLEALNFVSALS